jgi:hypothetical protein
MPGKTLPVFLPLLALGKIQFRDQLLRSLQGDRIAVFIIVANNVLLIPSAFCHAFAVMFQGEWEWDCPHPEQAAGIQLATA